MLRALPALLVLCLVQVGCTTTSAQVDTDQPKPNSKSDLGDADADKAPADDADADNKSHEDKPSRAPIAAAELPECPSAADSRSVLVNYCTEAGTETAKLAGAWVPVDTLRIPDDVEIIFNATGSDDAQRPSLLIAVRGDQLFVRQVTCGMCARVLGQGFAGHLSHMSAEQLAAMQTQLGLGDEIPTLTSVEAWTSFASAEQGKATLTTFAGKAEAAPINEGQ